MKEIFVDREAMRVGEAKSLLEAAGVLCYVRNEMSHNLVDGGFSGLMGPFNAVLCVTHEEDYDRAVEIIGQWLQKPPADPTAPDWICPSCRETVPAAFGECWSCQFPKPEPP